MKYRYLYQELKLLGWKKALFRLYYEIMRRCKPYLFPIKKQLPTTHTINLRKWQNNKLPFFIPDFSQEMVLEAYKKLFCERARNEIITNANRIVGGEILCFSKWWANYPRPVNWHKSAKQNSFWPKDVHSAMVYSYAKTCGDIKLVWEVNRFPHVYTLGRTYILTGNKVYMQTFLEDLHSWKQNNLYRAGVNWANGQELAIRVLSWIWSLYIFGEGVAFTNHDFQILQKLVFAHAVHIESDINYARYADHNNHLLGEALALYAIGELFPWFPQAPRWKKLGKYLLDNDCTTQFFSDGGYCQNSHTYQRLAIHYYMWYIRIAEILQNDVPQKVYNIVKRSNEYLLSFLNFADGTLNNWGCNDGALLCPWTQCDYRDFRPLLSATNYLLSGQRIFRRGLWDEELFFFFGKKSLAAKTDEPKVTSRVFPISGIHTLRQDQYNFATFRCGSVMDRFGQADQLHVDIFLKGVNIAVDAGTFSYFKTNDHKYFMGTKSHNTVTINNYDQMYLHRPFKWLDWSRAKLINSENHTITGEVYENSRYKVRHQRKVSYIDNGWNIEDQLQGKQQYSYALHWLLCDFPFRITKNTHNEFTVIANTPQGKFSLSISSQHKLKITIKKCERGWSPYYEYRENAISIRALTSGQHVYFFSRIQDLP